jgi:hypothetical protein
MADDVGALTPAVNRGCHARGVNHGAEVRVWRETASRMTPWGGYDGCEQNSGNAAVATAHVQPLIRRLHGMPSLSKEALGR